MQFQEAYQELMDIPMGAKEIKRTGWRYNTLRLTPEGLKYFRANARSTREGSDSISLDSLQANDWEIIPLTQETPAPVTLTLHCSKENARLLKMVSNDGFHTLTMQAEPSPNSVPVTITL